jgi:hypothetical protein
LLDFLAFCGYTDIHNHGFGGSKKKSYRGDTKASDEKQFRSSAETAILIIFLAVVLLYLRVYVENEMIRARVGTNNIFPPPPVSDMKPISG